MKSYLNCAFALRRYRLILVINLLLFFPNGVIAVEQSAKSSVRESQSHHLNRMSLADAVASAVSNDPWLKSNQLEQQAIMSNSLTASTWHDPKASLSLSNLAADSFAFDQEPMTQLKVGLSQAIPRGNSALIKQQQLELVASQHPFQR